MVCKKQVSGNEIFYEFINNALDQFVDEVGCEITGEVIMCTGLRKY